MKGRGEMNSFGFFCVLLGRHEAQGSFPWDLTSMDRSPLEGSRLPRGLSECLGEVHSGSYILASSARHSSVSGSASNNLACFSFLKFIELTALADFSFSLAGQVLLSIPLLARSCWGNSPRSRFLLSKSE